MQCHLIKATSNPGTSKQVRHQLQLYKRPQSGVTSAVHQLLSMCWTRLVFCRHCRINCNAPVYRLRECSMIMVPHLASKKFPRGPKSAEGAGLVVPPNSPSAVARMGVSCTLLSSLLSSRSTCTQPWPRSERTRASNWCVTQGSQAALGSRLPNLTRHEGLGLRPRLHPHCNCGSCLACSPTGSSMICHQVPMRLFWAEVYASASLTCTGCRPSRLAAGALRDVMHLHQFDVLSVLTVPHRKQLGEGHKSLRESQT